MSLASFFAQLLNGLAGASALFLVAAGLTLIFGVTRVVNFAHGSLYMLGAYIAYSLVATLPRGPFGFWGAVVLAALVVALIGTLLETLLLKRIYAAPELLQLAATFGVVLIVRDAALLVWGAEDLLGPRAPGLSGAMAVFGQVIPTYDLFLLAVGPLVLLALWALLERTRFGMLTRAATENRALASALGVNERMLFTAVFALGAFLAGLAGALQLPREPANLGMDLAIIAEAFVVTVVGGLGSIPGAFVAALLIGLTKALCIALGTVEFGGFAIAFPKLTLVAEFVVMAVVLVAKPYGLMGTAPAAPPTTPLAEFRALVVPPGRRAAIGALARARAGRGAAVDRRRVSVDPRDRHPRVHAVRREPAARDGHRRHGVVRARRVLRPRRVRRRAGGEARHPDGGRAAPLPARRACRRARDRLVLRPALRRLHGDAHARVRADRLVDRVPVGRRHRRLQRDRRRLAGRMARPASRPITGSRCR